MRWVRSTEWPGQRASSVQCVSGEQSSLITGCLASFLTAVSKSLTGSKWQEEGSVLAPSWRRMTVIVENSWWLITWEGRDIKPQGPLLVTHFPSDSLQRDSKSRPPVGDHVFKLKSLRGGIFHAQNSMLLTDTSFSKCLAHIKGSQEANILPSSPTPCAIPTMPSFFWVLSTPQLLKSPPNNTFLWQDKSLWLLAAFHELVINH